MEQPDQIEVLANWPQPEGGAPMPRIYADDHRLLLSYFTDEDKFAVVEFPVCFLFTFGSPNNEALSGHPLYPRGLQYYAVHRIGNSSRIATMERVNAVHPRHDPTSFRQDKTHLVFTFHDSTLECVVRLGDFTQPSIRTYQTAEEAQIAIRAILAKW